MNSPYIRNYYQRLWKICCKSDQLEREKKTASGVTPQVGTADAASMELGGDERNENALLAALANQVPSLAGPGRGT
jgi:hypothetical protein